MAAGEIDERRRPGSARLVHAIGFAQICSWGSLFYSFPLMAEAMRPELGWTKPQIYVAATIGLTLAAFAAYPIGSAIDRGQGRQVMGGASILAGLLLIAWSQVSELWLFYLIFAGIGCLQAATLYEPAFAVVARRLGAEGARRGITHVTLWGGFASTVFIPLIQLLIEWYGWRGALVWLGAINILVCGGIYLAVIDPRRDSPTAPLLHKEALPLSGRQAVSWAVRQPTFWALAAAFVAYAAAFSTLTFHLYPLLIERGLTAAGVVTVLAVIGPAQVAGRILIWLVIPNAPVRVFGSVMVVAFPLAAIGLALAPPDILVLGIIAAFYGAANGMMTIVRGLAVPEMLTRQAYGAINGALSMPIHLVQAFAPLVAAWLWAASGGYDAVLLAIIVGALVLVGSFWTAALLSRR